MTWRFLAVFAAGVMVGIIGTLLVLVEVLVP